MSAGTELAVDLMCVKMRSGVTFWVERARAERLMQLLESEVKTRFVRFEDEMLNVADVEGVYSAATMEDLERRKNGEWKCRIAGRWHDRFQKCECRPPAPRTQMYHVGEKVMEVTEDGETELLKRYPQAVKM